MPIEWVPEQIISRILFRLPVTQKAAMIIPLGRPLPTASSDTTREHRGGLPVLLFGLAPDGVYQAFPVTRDTGELLPRLFTLTSPIAGGAVSFLWHFP
jgi:hypothetical protein